MFGSYTCTCKDGYEDKGDKCKFIQTTTEEWMTESTTEENERTTTSSTEATSLESMTTEVTSNDPESSSQTSSSTTTVTDKSTTENRTETSTSATDEFTTSTDSTTLEASSIDSTSTILTSTESHVSEITTEDQGSGSGFSELTDPTTTLTDETFTENFTENMKYKFNFELTFENFDCSKYDLTNVTLQMELISRLNLQLPYKIKEIRCGSLILIFEELEITETSDLSDQTERLINDAKNSIVQQLPIEYPDVNLSKDDLVLSKNQTFIQETTTTIENTTSGSTTSEDIPTATPPVFVSPITEKPEETCESTKNWFLCLIETKYFYQQLWIFMLSIVGLIIVIILVMSLIALLEKFILSDAFLSFVTNRKRAYEVEESQCDEDGTAYSDSQLDQTQNSETSEDFDQRFEIFKEDLNKTKSYESDLDSDTESSASEIVVQLQETGSLRSQKIAATESSSKISLSPTDVTKFNRELSKSRVSQNSKASKDSAFSSEVKSNFTDSDYSPESRVTSGISRLNRSNRVADISEPNFRRPFEF